MTDPAPRYCSSCGRALHEGARFCGGCGAQLVSSPAHPSAVAQVVAQRSPAIPQPLQVATPPAHTAYPPQPQAGPEIQPEESIIQAIASLIRRKGVFGREPFLLLVTPQRLVFAAITAEQQKWAADQAKENARQQGKGFLKQWGAVITSLNFLVDTYRAMPVPQILAHHPDNYYIDLDQIQQVKTRVNWDTESNTPDEVELHYAGGKQKFELAGCSARDIKNALQPLLGSRVK